MSESSQRLYLRPVPGSAHRPGGWRLAGGLVTFHEVQVVRRGAPPETLPVEAAMALDHSLAEAVRRASASRAPLAGVDLSHPAVMGILNVTPDSFSDGGLHGGTEEAVAHGLAMAEAGAAILDIGGESTRPGSDPVPEAQELARVIPVIKGLRDAGCTVPISIDTRSATVAEAARAAGAALFNDVSALTHDSRSLAVAVKYPALCLMHALGDPKTMQKDPRYDDVLLDIYDYLEARLLEAEAAGIPRERALIDPGIGFGKRVEHNLSLIRGLSIYHSLGAPLLLGVSRKRFIGRISGEGEAARRAPGSIAAGLWGLGQGAHVLRVHDVRETMQAVAVWRALQDQGEGA